ncbi:cysteine proteinase inhibitor 5-like [Durio zibethinus]|uniref:Cysteine proteinase inhibitor 5-like n=1 Tax=Durio zibethinus TaxID=66656 RepID=A0A6P5WYS0_DURZI|nr:cysteine proteinase inhibitor 5-like [Durio zibethinus]
MHQNSRFLILLLSLLFLPIISSDARKDALVGGWTPIKNIKEPHVTEIGEFAVAEYNKQSNTSLELLKVVKGETQVVAGTNYRLVLNATDGAATNAYQAIVWEKAWQNFKNLTSFNLVNG